MNLDVAGWYFHFDWCVLDENSRDTNTSSSRNTIDVYPVIILNQELDPYSCDISGIVDT